MCPNSYNCGFICPYLGQRAIKRKGVMYKIIVKEKIEPAAKLPDGFDEYQPSSYELRLMMPIGWKNVLEQQHVLWLTVTGGNYIKIMFLIKKAGWLKSQHK